MNCKNFTIAGLFKIVLFGSLFLLNVPVMAEKTIDLQGHRGARGLLAENTLSSFAAFASHAPGSGLLSGDPHWPLTV